MKAGRKSTDFETREFRIRERMKGLVQVWYHAVRHEKQRVRHLRAKKVVTVGRLTDRLGTLIRSRTRWRLPDAQELVRWRNIHPEAVMVAAVRHGHIPQVDRHGLCQALL